MKLAIIPGSFDPPTYGHLDIIRRAARIFGRAVALAMINDQKQALFTPEERLFMLKESVRDIPGAEADFYGGMTYEFIAQHGAEVIVKGLRTPADFDYECQIALFNRRFAPQAETMFLYADPDLQGLSSSGLKQAFLEGRDVRDKAPPVVLEMLAKKYGKR